MNQRVLSPESAALLGFMELYSDFQLTVKLSDLTFTVLLHSHRRHNIYFSSMQLLAVKKKKL